MLSLAHYHYHEHQVIHLGLLPSVKINASILDLHNQTHESMRNCGTFFWMFIHGNVFTLLHPCLFRKFHTSQFLSKTEVANLNQQGLVPWSQIRIPSTGLMLG